MPPPSQLSLDKTWPYVSGRYGTMSYFQVELYLLRSEFVNQRQISYSGSYVPAPLTFFFSTRFGGMSAS